MSPHTDSGVDMVGAGRRLRFAAWGSGLVGLVLLVGAVALISSGYTSVTIVSASMEPTYLLGEHVLFDRINGGQVRRGDVVLYRVPDRYQGKAVLQRVIGVGGDRITDRPGEPLTVNGKPLTEPYVMDGDPSAGRSPFDVVVPAGRLFLLGDNRGDAYDCRYFLSDQSGTVAATAVQARVAQRVTGFILLASAGSFGFFLVLAALGLGIAARVARKRSLSTPPTPGAVLTWAGSHSQS